MPAAAPATNITIAKGDNRAKTDERCDVWLSHAVKLFLDVLDVDLIAITVERATPGRGGFLTAAQRPRIAEVVLHDGVARKLVGGLTEERLGLVEALLL